MRAYLAEQKISDASLHIDEDDPQTLRFFYPQFFADDSILQEIRLASRCLSRLDANVLLPSGASTPQEERKALRPKAEGFSLLAGPRWPRRNDRAAALDTTAQGAVPCALCHPGNRAPDAPRRSCYENLRRSLFRTSPPGRLPARIRRSCPLRPLPGPLARAPCRPPPTRGALRCGRGAR